MRKLSVELSAKIPGSKYFSWAEALWLPKVMAYAAPDDLQMSNIMKLARALDVVRDHFGRPISVDSWLRPQKYNELIGGASKSQHMIGAAIDFDVVGLSADEVRSVLTVNSNIWPYRGELGTPTWVHLDLAGTKWFWPGEKRK